MSSGRCTRVERRLGRPQGREDAELGEGGGWNLSHLPVSQNGPGTASPDPEQTRSCGVSHVNGHASAEPAVDRRPSAAEPGVTAAPGIRTRAVGSHVPVTARKEGLQGGAQTEGRRQHSGPHLAGGTQACHQHLLEKWGMDLTSHIQFSANWQVAPGKSLRGRITETCCARGHAGTAGEFLEPAVTGPSVSGKKS